MLQELEKVEKEKRKNNLTEVNMLKERYVLFAASLLCLPFLLLMTPIMLLARFGKPGRGVRIGLTVSDRWPALFQYVRIPYDLSILRAGGQVVTISPSQKENIPNLLESLDAVIVSGGEDVGDLGNELACEGSIGINRNRDELEREVISEARKRGMPMLCICRGMQLLALLNDGSVISHDNDPKKRAKHKSTLIALRNHKVILQKNSKLKIKIGKDSIRVNSIHHQHVADPGTLSVAAYADDEVIEALEDSSADFLIGVQWHPELMALFDWKEERLFKQLIAAAEVYGRKKIF